MREEYKIKRKQGRIHNTISHGGWAGAIHTTQGQILGGKKLSLGLNTWNVLYYALATILDQKEKNLSVFLADTLQRKYLTI